MGANPLAGLYVIGGIGRAAFAGVLVFLGWLGHASLVYVQLTFMRHLVVRAAPMGAIIKTLSHPRILAGDYCARDLGAFIRGLTAIAATKLAFFRNVYVA